MGGTFKSFYLLMAVMFVSVHGRPDHHSTGGGHHHDEDEHVAMLHRLTDLEKITKDLTVNIGENTNDLKEIRTIMGLFSDLLVPLADAEGKQELLLWAARHGNARSVQLLLQREVDVKATDQQKYTALHLAAKNGHTEIVKALVQANADPNAKGGDQRTPWDLAVLARHKEAAIALLAHKTLEENELKLLNAAKIGNSSQVVSLIKRGVNLEARDPENDYATPLILAAANGRSDVVKDLLKAKANTEARDVKGGTALYVAVTKKHRGAVEELLKSNADVTAKNAFGQTPEVMSHDDADIKALISAAKAKKVP